MMAGPVSVKKRTFKMEKLARIYDDQILPVWSRRFGRMLLRGLDLPEKGQILDVACGTGYPALEILRRKSPDTRLIAIDGSSAMLDVARKKVEEAGIKGVFFRSESAIPRLSFADDVYDLVVCNLGLEDMPDPAVAVADFARVTRPGGQVRCTTPLEGTFEEFFDIYREVLIKHDKHDVLDRLNQHLAQRYPPVEECNRWLADAGLDPHRVEVEEFSMLFKSSREFFFAPVIEFGPLTDWKAIAGSGQEMQDIFWFIKEAIDAYFGGRAFQVTVKAGCLIGTKAEPRDDDETGRVSRSTLDDLGAGEQLDITTEEIDVDDIEETYENLKPVEDPLERRFTDGDEIDAFRDGAARPDHLDED
jgi:ubiquinone/menaquinone biosynthesis C-methylase UbiE